MFIVIAVIIIIFCIMIGAIFLMADYKRKEAAHQLKAQITDAKHRYKLDIETICEALELPVLIRDKLYSIANNYFVYQPITIDTVEGLITTLKQLSLSYNLLLEHQAENVAVELINDHMKLFSESLPVEVKGFNEEFYSASIIELTKLLDIVVEEPCDENLNEDIESLDLNDDSDLQKSA